MKKCMEIREAWMHWVKIPYEEKRWEVTHVTKKTRVQSKQLLIKENVAKESEEE